MTESLRCGQFVKYALPQHRKEGVALTVAQDDYVSKAKALPKLVMPTGAALPLDAFKSCGGKVLEALPHNHPEASLAIARFLAPEGFFYDRQPVVRTFYHEDCLVAYLRSQGPKVKVLPLNPNVSANRRNRLHAVHTFKRISELPKDYRKPRQSGFGKGDLVRHPEHGLAVHLGPTVLFEKPYRMWPNSKADLRFADWVAVATVDTPGSLLRADSDKLDFDRDLQAYPEPEAGFGPNSLDLPHDWERRKSHCAKCGSDSLRSTNLIGLGIARFCDDCTWTCLVPTVRTTLRTILAAEQEFRLSCLASATSLRA